MLGDHRRDEIEILVVCNGCSDDTAKIARAFGEPVRVIETEIPSKSRALNLGDAEAKGFPRIYLDADVVMTLPAIRKLAEALESKHALAAAPRPENVFLPGTQWGVREYYKFWMALPYIRAGMIAAGVYALSRQGRERFKGFPDVIADDGYVRMLFEPHERLQVCDAVSKVFAPLTLRDLLKIKTRSRLGVMQLQMLYPELAGQEVRTKNYMLALISILRRPLLYISAFPYAYVLVMSRLRAQRQLTESGNYVWERDDSSRQAGA